MLRKEKLPSWKGSKAASLCIWRQVLYGKGKQVSTTFDRGRRFHSAPHSAGARFGEPCSPMNLTYCNSAKNCVSRIPCAPQPI